MLVLDVGCGFRPRGNINIDIARKWIPLMYEYDKDKSFAIQKIPNFILASACNLPFKDKIFDKVISFSVLEHIPKPFQALSEIVRVCKAEANVYVPHRFSPSAKKPYHVSFFNLTWFKKAFDKLGIHNYDAKLTYKYLPHPFLPIVTIPRGIRMRFWVSPI